MAAAGSFEPETIALFSLPDPMTSPALLGVEGKDSWVGGGGDGATTRGEENSGTDEETAVARMSQEG